MTDEKKQEQREEYRAPAGSEAQKTISLGGSKTRYHVAASWTVLRKREVPFAEMFSVTYEKQPRDPKRPITFVLNGGPGASSAYLHLGALGPRRVVFSAQGGIEPPPAKITDNQETWLAFTDLVFVDPIGTGLSRTLDELRFEKAPPKDENEEKLLPRGENNKEYYAVKRDIDSLCEFVQRALDRLGRWLSPVYIAGESYGGYRVAKLSRALQERYGVGLSGAILISPALEPNGLDGTDYETYPWLDVFPTMALAALHHGRSRALPPKTSPQKAAAKLETFAVQKLARALVAGNSLAENERRSVVEEQAAYLGLEPEFIERKGLRLRIQDFTRELLRDRRRVLGLYDASVSVIDPFPDRNNYEGPDPTLNQAEFAFCSGINHLLRNEIGLQTERRYHLMSEEVNRAWKDDQTTHFFERQVGSTDDLRFGMSINPHMQVWITHGWYDLVTPYFSSRRIAYHLKLLPEQEKQLRFSTFRGGHMYYTWDESREAFLEQARKLYGA